MIGEIILCGICKRKMLIERDMIGVNHTIGTYINCWNCLTTKQREKVEARYADTLQQ